MGRRLWFDLGAVVGATVAVGLGWLIGEMQKKALQERKIQGQVVSDE